MLFPIYYHALSLQASIFHHRKKKVLDKRIKMVFNESN